MNTPWIESSRVTDQEKQVGTHVSDYDWQALFACQVGIRSHEEWAKLKWGFNALALFDEFLERQKLFLEANYSIRNEMRLENPDQQTLVFRYIQRPEEGVRLTILGKIHARTEAEAARNAAAFYRGIHSTFPYDYHLIPACTRQEFLRFSGQDILDDKENDSGIAQIRRAEIPAVPDRKSPFLQGLWQTGAHAHESIWRSLASAPNPVLMNVLLRSTILYEREQSMLLKGDREISEIEEGLVNPKTLTTIQEWSARYTERRLMPWKKFFYLQVHLASSGTLDEHICRIIGTSLTLTAGKDGLPGHQVIVPKRDEESIWRKQLTNLNLTLSNSRLSLPRLADIADLDEVFAVIRLPYSPPDQGFPDIVFAPAAKE